MMNKRIIEILYHFKIDGAFIDARPFGSGHTNETILIKLEQKGEIKSFILRKLNKKIFKDPKVVVSNTINAINHISQKVKDIITTEFLN